MIGSLDPKIINNPLTGEKQKMKKEETTRKLIPVPQWNDHHLWPPIGGLRHLIFNKDTNGFAMCVVKLGRSVLIDEEKFFEWVDTYNEFKKAS